MPANRPKAAARSAPAAVGFRVKSGWATAVLLVGPAREPRLADRSIIELSDRSVPSSRQPYHAVMGASPANASKVERRLHKVVEQVTRRSVRQLLRGYGAGGHRVRAAALVVGSEIDPARIANDHIRAHALEGRLFRTVLAAALASCGLRCTVVVEREAYAHAAGVLARTETDLRRAVAELGRSRAGPWRAEEKTAALAAWVLLRRGR